MRYLRISKIYKFLLLIYWLFFRNCLAINKSNKKNFKFKWTLKYKQAFNNLKYYFITTLNFTYFNSDFKYIIKTDLFNYVLGGVLL